MEWEELLTSQHDIWGNFFFFSLNVMNSGVLPEMRRSALIL